MREAEIARLAYKGGADVVQLRMKGASARDMLDQAREMKSISDEFTGLFIVNDRVDIAMLADADGVHLGQSDIPLAEARKLLGDDRLIGISVHSVEEARIAEDGGADYISVGSIFATSTKPDAIQQIGLDMVFMISQEVDMPLVAIGGINLGNIPETMRAGADCVAVASAIFKGDVISNIREMRTLSIRSRLE